jgi:hypothetical protein
MESHSAWAAASAADEVPFVKVPESGVPESGVPEVPSTPSVRVSTSQPTAAIRSNKINAFIIFFPPCRQMDTLTGNIRCQSYFLNNTKRQGGRQQEPEKL